MMCYPFEFYRWPKLYLTHLNCISWLCRTVVGKLGNTEFLISNICSLKQDRNERLEMDFGTPTTGAGWSMTLFCLYYFFFLQCSAPSYAFYLKKKSLVFVCFAVGELYQIHKFLWSNWKNIKKYSRNKHLWEVFSVNLSCLRIWRLRRVHHLFKVRSNSTQPFKRFTYLKYSERRKKMRVKQSDYKTLSNNFGHRWTLKWTMGSDSI